MSEETLELERETANEVDRFRPMAGPKDLLYPKYTPPPQQSLRDILLADPFFGFYMRYYDVKIRNMSRHSF